MTAGHGNVVSGSALPRLLAYAETRRSLLLLVEAICLAAGVAIFLASVLPNLANHPTVTDDEMWIMSSAYKLATKGVFGSDMFAGFFGADRHYYFNMPGQHFALAAAFKLLGAGVLQARLVGVGYGLATLILTYLLARRVAGVPAAILTLALLLFVRFNMGFDTGLPLQELSASMRYDLAPVPFLLGGVLVLLGGWTVRRAVVAGALFGVAVLLQFYAAFVFPVILVALALEDFGARRKLQLAGALAGVAILLCLPYGAYALAHLHDFRGQLATLEGRDDLTSPSFYFDNVVNEPDRFLRPLGFKDVPRGEDFRTTEPRYLSLSEMAQRRPSAKLAVIAGLPLSIAYFGWRWRRQRSRPDLLMLLLLVGLPLQYALFESLKLYIYWIPVLPFLCTGIAAFSLRLLQGLRQSRLQTAAALAACLALAIFFAEGSVARVNGMRVAGQADTYAALSQRLHSYIPGGSRVVGSTSLWWALRDTDYRSYFLFFYLTNPDAGEYRTTIDAYLRDSGAQYLVLTRLAASELDKHLVPKDHADYDAYLREHGMLLVRLEGHLLDNSYGFVDVWQLR